MNELANLQNIERRISYHIQGAYANILEVGRCLIEAKEANLVPYGQWESWVQRTTGMSERSAQRLMQAAREVAPDSAMAKLPISKIQAILALPEPEREPVAEKAVAENQSLRTLQREVEKLRKDLELSRETEAFANRRAADSDFRAKSAMAAAETARKNVDIALTERNAMEVERDAARELLREQLESVPAGISKEAQAEIGRLQAALSDAEQMAEYQAAQRQQAQRELMEIKGKAARGDVQPVEDLTAESVAVAVKVFIGTVGYLPHSERLTAMSYQDRQQVHAFARMIGKWAGDVQNALDNVNEAIVILEASHE